MDSDEKRDFHRLTIHCGLHFTKNGKGKTFKATAVNISSTGVLFECEEALKIGDQIQIEVPSDGPARKLRAQVKVIRVTPSTQGGFSIGGEIIEKLDLSS